MNEANLIQRARAGDEEAYGVLVRRYQDRVYRTAVRMVGDEDAHDVTQDVFIKAWRELKRFRGDSALSTWLHRMTINLSLNHIRSSKREQGRREQYGPGVSTPPPAPDASLLDEERTRLVWQAIDSLPERQRTAIIMYRFEEMSAPRIAEVLNLSVGAVESLLHRAKLTLLEFFQAQGMAPKRGRTQED
jgi:RNA polymerase sigma-70 factor (ECF subfamily)